MPTVSVGWKRRTEDRETTLRALCVGGAIGSANGQPTHNVFGGGHVTQKTFSVFSSQTIIQSIFFVVLWSRFMVFEVDFFFLVFFLISNHCMPRQCGVFRVAIPKGWFFFTWHTFLEIAQGSVFKLSFLIFFTGLLTWETTLYVFTFQRDNVDGEIYATETIFISYKLFFTCDKYSTWKCALKVRV